MVHPRLTAPRILRLQKVATYAQARLHELGYRFTLAPVFWDAAAREQAAASALPQVGPQVRLLPVSAALCIAAGACLCCLSCHDHGSASRFCAHVKEVCYGPHHAGIVHVSVT